MNLRQVALVAEQLAPVRQDIFAVLGIDADFADNGVAEFGLENSVMTIGKTFLSGRPLAGKHRGRSLAGAPPG